MHELHDLGILRRFDRRQRDDRLDDGTVPDHLLEVGEQASLVGTSLGGMIAQEMALAHPERIDKLVLVATIPGGARSRPMPLGTTYLLASALFMTSKAKLREFVQKTLGAGVSETISLFPSFALQAGIFPAGAFPED